MVDLHVHSTRSDGTFTPTQLVDHAMEKGLSAFALTDHDTTDGIREASEYAASLPNAPEIIPGIELSTDLNGTEVHVVGLFIDPASPPFRDYLKEFVESRTTRNKKMAQKLQDLGMEITYEALEEAFPDCILTRAHFASYLRMHGYVSSNQEAFDRYLGNRRPCYVPREKISPCDAVRLILSAGGLPILAHPILYRMSEARLEDLVITLKKEGLVGIEAIYSTYLPSEERQIRRLAATHGLLISGGSDFHGANKPKIDMGTGLGKLYVPDEVLEALRARLSEAPKPSL
ncbi:MAG: PHP domain-containing protein [Lachnospiraceae bacterium]|nr:PHP domain-containing protein [Lachnospiraceae bacterium]